MRRLDDAAHNLRAIGLRNLPLARHATALPASSTARLYAATGVAGRLAPYLRRDRDALGDALGGALVVAVGVPEREVAGQAFTHHQLLQDYARPLGDGNNMFVSVSAPGDTDSAPPGHRAVMVSTHTELSAWEGLGAEAYTARKREMSDRLVGLARRVYPTLGEHAVVREIGTPRTYGKVRAAASGRGRRRTADAGQRQPARRPARPRSPRLLAGRRLHVARPRHRRVRGGEPDRRGAGAALGT